MKTIICPHCHGVGVILDRSEVESPTGPCIYADTMRNIQAFERFWSAYPKKQCRPDAEHAFFEVGAHLKLDTVIAAVHAQAASPDWIKNGGQYVPQPANWLRNRRWEDSNGANDQEQQRLIRELLR